MTDTKTETTALSSDATEVRRQKLALLREQIGDVYPAHFHRTMSNAELAEKYADIEADVETGDTVTVAGRVYSSRNSGMFMDIHDASGKVQIFSHKDTTPEAARNLLPMIDIGDIIGVTGKVRRTKRGELTINAEEITMLTKSLLPMPEKWHGVSDIELRYRKRHLDILSNEESKLRFLQRSKILSGIRRFMEAEGFLEVETPMLQTVYGGATADPFKTFHNTLKMDMYLRIAPELFLKRTLVSGLSDKVFEINRNFRNEGVSVRHNPEFTMMEFYAAYTDYKWIMDFTEQVIRQAAIDAQGSAVLSYGGRELDLSKPFQRLTIIEAIDKYAPGYTPEQLNDAEFIKNELKTKFGVKPFATAGLGALQLALFEETAEALLWEPTFIVDYPAEVSPLARASDTREGVTERFELFMVGREIANGFSELNDPEDQAARFLAQVAAKDAGDDEAMFYDADYIRALEYGMPPAGGCGIGIDRLMMLITDSPNIRDVLLFPHLRKED